MARCILGVLPRPPAQIRAGEVRFQGQDLLHAPEAALTARVRGKAITFIPQDPQASLNPLFPVGVQLRDLLAWGTQSAAALDRYRSRLSHCCNRSRSQRLRHN